MRSSYCHLPPCAYLWLGSAALYVLGMMGMLAMPFAARNTYMDENALLAGERTEKQCCVMCADAFWDSFRLAQL